MIKILNFGIFWQIQLQTRYHRQIKLIGRKKVLFSTTGVKINQKLYILLYFYSGIFATSNIIKVDTCILNKRLIYKSLLQTLCITTNLVRFPSWIVCTSSFVEETRFEVACFTNRLRGRSRFTKALFPHLLKKANSLTKIFFSRIC